MYAVYHGPDGLTSIATRTHRYAAVLARALTDAGHPPVHGRFFDTLTVPAPGRAADVVASARSLGIQLRLIDDDHVGITTSEQTTRSTITSVLRAFGVAVDDLDGQDHEAATRCPTSCAGPRSSSPTRSSPATTARPRCCATCAASRPATTPWTGA